MFVYTYPNTLMVCSDCARAIIQTGISDVYVQSLETIEHWQESCDVSMEMFSESGVNLWTSKINDMSILTKVMENTLKSA